MAPLALLAGCQNSALDLALIEKAQETAAMPECPSLRVLSTWQAYRADIGYHLSVDFAGTSQCVDRWRERLDDGGWLMDAHGWRFKDGFEVTVSFDRTRATVDWIQSRPEPNIADETAALKATVNRRQG